MKKLAYILVAFVIVAVGFTACKREEIETTQTAPTTTLVDYLANDDVATMLAGIEDGSKVPARLHYYAANSCECDVSDPQMIARIFSQLMREEILLEPQDIAFDDGTVIFSFVWEDGQSYNISFETSSYFADKDGTLYPLSTESAVGQIMNELFYYAEDGPRDEVVLPEGSVVDLSQGNFFTWDSDGDGTPETYEISFIHNGDEAPDVLVITDSADSNRGLYLDGAYEIKELRACEDEKGPYLAGAIYMGDYYSHDHLRGFIMRLDGEMYTIEEI